MFFFRKIKKNGNIPLDNCDVSMGGFIPEHPPQRVFSN